MTRKQMALMVLLSAVVSAFVSLAVVAGAVLLLRDRVAFVTPAAATATRPPADGWRSCPLPGRRGGVHPRPEQSAEGATSVIHTRLPATRSAGSLQYDVPAQDIISANQIQNPNFLTVGAKLVIPIGASSKWS